MSPGRTPPRYVAEARIRGGGEVHVRETLEAHGAELARRFWVPRAPLGPLTVDFLLGSASLTQVQGGSATLETPDGPQRWSRPVWVDAAGRRTELAWSGDETMLHVE